MTTLKLTNPQTAALTRLLRQVLEHVNYGAGVDAWLGDPTDEVLLLDPDEPENGLLVEVLLKLGVDLMKQHIQGAGIRDHMLDVITNNLEAKGFKKNKAPVNTSGGDYWQTLVATAAFFVPENVML